LVRAPFAGRTGARLVDRGNYLQDSIGTSLVSITLIKPIYANFTLPATKLDAIRQNEAASKLEADAIGTRQ
jgi:multidrug efflux system membrane fusion protein